MLFEYLEFLKNGDKGDLRIITESMYLNNPQLYNKMGNSVSGHTTEEGLKLPIIF